MTSRICICSNCNHVNPKTMRCQRFPPQYIPTMTSGPADAISWWQPKVMPDGFCSEWEEMTDA